MTSADLLTHPRYEVLPFGDVENAVLEHVPIDVTLTVTVSPRKGIERTGFHVFTFNDLADTEHWRRRRLAVAAPML